MHNKAANAVTDMTTVCDLSGITSYTVPFPTQVGSVFSGTQVTGGSILRFYNGGTTAYPVTLTLRDVVSGASLGTWTSPNIAPGAAPQFGIDEIEAAIGLTKHDTDVVGVDTNIDGVFQHLAWRAPDGVMANLSTCAGGATTGDGTVIGVHGSAVADYPSSVIVNNTGDAGAAATLAVYDARDGTRLGAYASAAIAGHSQLQLDAAAIEAGAKIAAGAPRYVIKLEGAFPGYLQHFVTNTAAGAISDMTPACLM